MFNAGSLVESIVGLGTKLATSIPGMRKAKKADSAAAIARSAGSQFGGAVGAAQAGHGLSRGLALREGLRQGVQAVGAQSKAIGQAAAADAAMNEANRQKRASNIAAFGGDLAKGLGDMAAASIGPETKGAEMPSAEQPQEQFMTGPQVPGTGVSELPLAPDDSADLDDIQQGFDAQQTMDQQAAYDAAAERLQDFKAKREEAGIGMDDPMAPKAAFQEDPTSKLIESAPPVLAPQIEQQLADKLHVQELARAEMERLGLSYETMLPRLSRRLGLRPGQSSQNPLGVGLNFEGEGEA